MRLAFSIRYAPHNTDLMSIYLLIAGLWILSIMTTIIRELRRDAIEEEARGKEEKKNHEQHD